MDKPTKKMIIGNNSMTDKCRGYNKSHDEFTNYFKYLLSKIPSDDAINDSAITGFATSYYQGKFDLLMDLIHEE